MKVTKLTKLLISFMGGGKIDFPTRHLRDVEIEGDGLDGGGGQEEVDEIKMFLDERSAEIKSSEDYYYSEYSQVLDNFVSKEEYVANPLPEQLMNILTEQGKVKGDINNFDYVIFDFDDETPIPSLVVFITEEQFNYFQKSIIKTSTKDFIISSLKIDNLEQVFGGINLSGENAIKNNLAIDKEDFKFAIGSERNETMVYTILDDIDLSYYVNPYGEILIIFDENETRKIFKVEITPLNNDPSNKFSYLNFISSDDSNATIKIEEFNNKNYKYIDVDVSIPN